MDNTSSKVMSIIDKDSAVSGWVLKSGGGHVIVRGDLLLKEGLCSINYTTIKIDVAIGDVIETSGLGGIYPKGILIGKVKEIREANN